MIEPRFPGVLDNTMLKAFRVCPQRFFNEYCLGLKPKDAGVPLDLHFGHCFDVAVTVARQEYFYRAARQALNGFEAEDAVSQAVVTATQEWQKVEKIDAPSYTNKSLGSLIQTIAHYFATWPLGEDGLTPIEGGIQMHLQEELPFIHSETGKPLMYAYNPDFVARNDMGGIVVVDEKTAGKFSDSWMAQWDMDTQMTGYIKAASVYCAPGELPHALVRGVCPGTSKSPPGHMLVPVFRTEFQIDVWERQLHADIERMLAMWNDLDFDRNLGVGCVTYGRACEYTGLCNSPNANQLVEANFEQSFWNPVTRKMVRIKE